MAYSPADYKFFLEDLKRLVSLKTVFFESEGIEAAMAVCRALFEKRLPAWKFHSDEGRNLYILSPDIDASQEILYLTAHLDTVGADPADWVEDLDPFQANETSTHLIGRGVNDCKAGVALMLHLAHLIQQGKFQPFNGGFLVTFQEEGNRSKTSVFYSESLSKTLPLSTQHTYFMTLENTVSLKNPLEIAVYDQEPCNVFITLKGDIPTLREHLKRLPEWKPTVIVPEGFTKDQWESWPSLSHEGGHSCSLPNAKNQIHQMILSGEYDEVLLACGDPAQGSVVASKIYHEKSVSASHQLILNYRAIVDVATLKEELKGILYEETFGFVNGSGSDQKQYFQKSSVKKYFDEICSPEVSVVFTPNPGRSDSSMIWNSLSPELRGRVIPFTCGPGHRSHTDGSIPRKTHGVNEGFDKAAGEKLMPVFFEFISRFEF